MRAGLQAFHTADTAGAVNLRRRIQPSGAGLSAQVAVLTAAFLEMQAHAAHPVERPVDGAQRADESAERPAGNHHPQQEEGEDDHFDGEEQAGQLAQVGLERDHGQAGFQGAGGAELAEPGFQGNKWDDHHQQGEYRIARRRPAVADAPFGQRYLIEQVLQEPERTCPAAGGAAKEHTNEAQHPQQIQRQAAEDNEVLERADGTGGDSQRAGVAVEARTGDVFQPGC